MANYHKPESKAIQELRDIAHRLRIHSINSTQASNSGHPTSCSSMAEIMSVLFFQTMRYNVSVPLDPSNDRFILSKGHAAPILYAAWSEAGLFPASELLNLRKIDSDLEGHPTPRLNFVDVGTGSLGQGVAVAAGMAYVGKYFDKASYRTYVLVGDGESAEGSVWESLHFAGHYNLNNLCVIFDVNRLGQSEPTSLKHQTEVYRKRLDAFGLNALVVDGHDVEELCKAFFEASTTKDRPTAIIAKSYKGKFFPKIEDSENWHGKPLGSNAQEVIEYLTGLIKNKGIVQLQPQQPAVEDAPVVDITNIRLATPPAYKLGESVATRLAYGTALTKIADNNSRVIALDGDTKNSTFSDKIKIKYPERYIECFIAEQNLVGVAIGAACRNRTVPFVSTFATFFTRAFDQIRMGAISQTNVNFVGSHCGVSIGEDGPSQMGLEDIALFRTIPGSTIFYPADAVSCERSIELAANTKGVCFIRTSRPNTAVIYRNDEQFQIGKAKVVKQSAKDQVLLIGAGITLYEALTASAELEKAGVSSRVLDPFTVKPIDREAIILNAQQCNGRIVVVEDHYFEGGLGDAVKSAVAEQRNIVVKHLAVPTIPRSGPPTVLIDLYGISARNVINAVAEVLKFHPTSCSSMAEIMSVLFFQTMRYNVSVPLDPSNDRFILSKGHAAPILYAAWSEAGLFPASELLNLRKIDSDLEGHPTPRLNFVDVGTGSLGQGVAVAAGMAYVGKYFDKASYRTYVLVGDGESAEGSVWESLHFAGHYNLNNLCVIFDVNRLGQSEPTSLKHQTEVYRKRLDAFGLNALVVDGHDVEELCKAFFEASTTKDRPTAIIAKSYKGKFFPKIEDSENWHGKPLGSNAQEVIEYLTGLIKNKGIVQLQPQQPAVEDAPVVDITNIRLATPPAYKLGESVATRLAYGTALTKIADNNSRVIALDGDTKNSTFSDKIKIKYPERYIECFIAEQNLVGVAIGAACRNRTVPFVSTFATFFTRAFDQIRMGAISQTNVNFVGSHCGVSIGEDGPSQMGLEDIALFRTIPGSTIFYPADAVSCERSIKLAANTKGVCFIRTSRPNTAVIYRNDEQFQIGKAKVVKQSAKDQVLLIGAGITLYEALTASAELEKAGVSSRVLDPFTVKPIDREAIILNAQQCNGRIVVVEDHYFEGGLGDAVKSAVAEQRNIVVKHLAVPTIPRSGPPTVLIDLYGISARNVINAVAEVLKL